jgi:hypothetical protein
MKLLPIMTVLWGGFWQEIDRVAHVGPMGPDPGHGVGAGAWKRDFVRAMNQLVMWDMRATDGDVDSGEGRSADNLPSVCSR